MLYTEGVTKAFSLVELSIVLVILGLLTGGILAGQSLIRAAELRSVSSEMSRYSTAIYTFRDKYFALPGDMANAFAFWGATAGCTNVNVNTDTAGCNGNGDGFVISGSNDLGESSRAWQHLALAGLIEGTYSGVEGTGTWTPRSRMGQAPWHMKSWSGPAAHGWTSAPSSQTLMLAIDYLSGMKPEEAWNLDTKLDDGRAYNGKVFPHPTAPAGCTGGAVWGATASDYVLTSSSPVCTMFMLIQ